MSQSLHVRLPGPVLAVTGWASAGPEATKDATTRAAAISFDADIHHPYRARAARATLCKLPVRMHKPTAYSRERYGNGITYFRPFWRTYWTQATIGPIARSASSGRKSLIVSRFRWWTAGGSNSRPPRCEGPAYRGFSSRFLRFLGPLGTGREWIAWSSSRRRAAVSSSHRNN